MLYKLYLDETGTPSLNGFNPGFPYFILSGFIVDEAQANNIKIKADQVKFKYWGRTNIVLHSREIGRRENDFALLKDPSVEKNFHKDLSQLLILNGGRSVLVVVNKDKAKNLGWKADDIYRNTSKEMLRFFIEVLHHKNDKGQIIIESAGTQKDVAFYKEYIYFLSNGIQSLGIDHHKMKKILTSISFVSKNNQDIETQIADLLAYPAGYSCLVTDGTKAIVPNSYEDNLCKILSAKILRFKDRKTGLDRDGFINLTP
ncbi:hypothetical protein A2333_01960 [Candidatus Wolfebacteria bacterium RIFOXYB2_FULL_49_7]|uniref:DUF3800 domain-containing protein n=1 Tax=Candidatus Wolfebacteria bacterium RIFOXYB1_FULL_54_12 TaxID=1802559 RepID=A0A1F8DWH7_9BACT|nr:MAG: hypothetical protein A2372_03665 [Candidatus Wolfebacteria bacterium RIFOXYB1_FULL_54_12]OGM93434.1 MAG: hypothetical protein A2333_01960 [Candidatus Wolfebacteria bacterium RIFOXYB2_FULL_49_7]